MSRKMMCCRFCTADLWHQRTFIKCSMAKCVELDVNLCLHCFAAGTSDSIHKNTDPYRVLTNAVETAENSWPANDEIVLLDTFMNTMSWEKVAQKLDRSAEECERYYFDRFVFYSEFKSLTANAFRLDTSEDRRVEYRPTIIGNESESEESYHHQYEVAIRLAGYQPARGTFEEEYDDQAEDILQLLKEPFCVDEYTRLDEEMDSLNRKTNQVILDIFNDRLQERHRRRKIVKDYGLVEYNKHQLWIKSMEIVLGPEMMQHLIRFAHLLQPLAFDFIVNNLKQEYELLAKIHKLTEYRKNGITQMAQISVYEELKTKREESLKNRPSGLSTQKIIENTKPRINVFNLPGFQKLDDNERELCAQIKMLPESYLKFKELLINECEKSRGIILKTARSLIKIDVNKTRKIYNLLISKNIIWQNSRQD